MASTWLISSRFCWEIPLPSSSDTQPSQDRHALSNTCWTEVDSLTWGKQRFRLSTSTSNTNECLFIHPPPNQTQTKQQMCTAVYQITTQSVCLTHKRSNETYLSICNTFLLQWVYTFITFFLVALKGGNEGK